MVIWYFTGCVVNMLVSLSVEDEYDNWKFTLVLFFTSWAGLFLVIYMGFKDEYGDYMFTFFLFVLAVVVHLSTLYYTAVLNGNLLLLTVPLLYIVIFLKYTD